MTDIETAVNAQLAALSVALNPNGTLKNGAVSTASIQDRAVTLAKLAFLSSFYAVDSGAANAMLITFIPPLTAYVEGLDFLVKAAATNTGATTINVDGVGLRNVMTFDGAVLSPLLAGQIVAGNIYELVHDGVEFIILNPSNPSSVSGPVFIGPQPVYVGGAIAFTEFDASAYIPAGAKAAKLQVQARWNTAVDGECNVSTRADPGANIYLIGRVGGTDAVVMGCQAEIQIGATRHFWYRVTETVALASTVAIDLIGYIV